MRYMSVVYGNWSLQEVLESSTWRDLKAVWLVMLSLKSFLAGKNVKCFTDNKNVGLIADKAPSPVNRQGSIKVHS